MADNIAEDQITVVDDITSEEELGFLHYYEIMDRCHMILENLEDHILNHVALQFNPDMQKMIEEAQAKIYTVSNMACGKYDDLYQKEIDDNWDGG